MKKCIILSVLALVTVLRGSACGGYFPQHDYDIFNIYSPDYSFTNSERLSHFWAQYTGDDSGFRKAKTREVYESSDYYFANNCALLLQAARRKKDKEMIVYLQQTLRYKKICDEMQETWEYPTQEQLDECQNILLEMQRVGKNYRGTRLKAQYSLLYMRANLLLKRYEDNQVYWLLTASKFPESVFKDMMQSLYANAILHVGQWRKACDIYVEQDDWVSVEWAMRNYRNPAGIQRIYKEAPNSPALAYLLQYYINGGYGWEWSYDYFQQDNGDIKKEMADFIRFIDNDVMHNNKVKDKAMWKAAAAMLHYYNHEYATAQKDIEEAERLPGSPQMKDNVRCIKLLISTQTQKVGNAYSVYLTGELKWLLQKREQARNREGLFSDNYYDNVLDRMIYKELVPKFQKEVGAYQALALLALIDGINLGLEPIKKTEWIGSDEKKVVEYSSRQLDYEYASALNELTADALKGYYQYLQTVPEDPLQHFALQHAYKNAELFNDLIGTAYLGEGKFEIAIPHLEKVSLRFLDMQGIAPYANVCDFTKDRWLTKQVVNYSEISDSVQLKSNKKLDFCREMLQLFSQYKLARNKEVAAEKAYTLASRYYQASYFGDCWYLTAYYKSVVGIDPPIYLDFVQEALKYLKVSRTAKNKDLKLKSLFAEAHIQYHLNAEDALLDHDTWFEDIRNAETVYGTYGQLANFIKRHKIQENYITQCDILQAFMEKQH